MQYLQPMLNFYQVKINEHQTQQDLKSKNIEICG